MSEEKNGGIVSEANQTGKGKRLLTHKGVGEPDERGARCLHSAAGAISLQFRDLVSNLRAE